MAWPFVAVYVCLVVYASLYPFTGWRSQGISPVAFLWAPWPQYWTGFDVAVNVVGYAPLGLLLTVAWARSGSGRWWWLGGVLPALLSLGMEALQSFMVQRVPSQVDWLLNSAGGLLGMATAWALLRWQWLGPWTAFRDAALVRGQGLGVLLLALWPVALLYPTPVPFGLGNVWGQVESLVHRGVQDSFLAGWQPLSLPSVPLSPLTQAVVVALCIWAPLLLAYALVRPLRYRLRVAAAAVPWVLCSAWLSAALTYGPHNGWAWLTPQTSLGLVLAVGLGVISFALSYRTAAVLSLVAWAFALGLLNQAPEVAYFSQSLQGWEQGRFIHFHGLSQWLGWLWPYAAMAVALRLAVGVRPRHYNPTA